VCIAKFGNLGANGDKGSKFLVDNVIFGIADPDLPIHTPFTFTWPHLRCDVGLEEGEYRENCLCLAVLCTIIMMHKDMSSSYRSVNCIGL